MSLLERYENLHVVVRLRELVRKWWKIEVSFASRRGFVLDHARGKIIPPPRNSFCQMFLGSKKGLSLCDESVRACTEEAKKLGKSKAFVTKTCHAGFPMIVVPLYIKGRFYGVVFAGGFLISEGPMASPAADLPATAVGGFGNEVGFDREGLYQLARPYNAQKVDFDRAWTEIPRLSLQELDHLTEILEIGVQEIAAYHEEITKKDRVISHLTRELKERYRFDRIIGKSAPMKSLYDLLDKICASDSTVLVQGENGTGKELVARAIHYNSPRRDKPFVIQNCSAFNDNLLDSELFGHVKGAFTGAIRDKKGLFEVADGGTFFLDEIGDMTPALQVKVLRVLQEGTFMPVGGTETRKVDVRILAATNKDLRKMVADGTFREDLFYRINVINIVVPSLRKRKEDIPMLIDHFLAQHADHFAKTGKGSKVSKKISKKAMRRLLEYDWPGNIRELENEIERLVVLAGDDEVITEEMLSTKILEGSGGGDEARLKGKLKDALESVERDMIADGLTRTNGNKTRLAKELGISRANLIMKVQKYNLERAGRRA
ncbi:MAG TPA: sigma 54-interacting transcriptional regulator [bacterium]|nr:sigma 54-interacting transcriptional regulator [bacterium]